MSVAGSPIFAAAVDAYHEARAVWLDLIEVAYLKAEAATRGHMLNRRGRDAGIDPRSLFYGTEVRARAYASEELLEHWRQTPGSRLPWREFERQHAGQAQVFVA